MFEERCIAFESIVNKMLLDTLHKIAHIIDIFS